MSISIGIDIAKDKIDVYYHGTHAQIPNEKKAICAYFKPFKRDCRLVMEATGVYHRVTHRTLEEMGFKPMVVNPYQSKHFAHALNLLCKTDKVDAKMLALFAETMEYRQTDCPSKQQQKLQDLSRHLADLKQLKVDVDMRVREARGMIKQSLSNVLRGLNTEIKRTEAALREEIEGDEALQKKMKLLMTIPGIGETTAICLLSSLRELGQVSKQEIAALSGLAPVNNDSGHFKGKRRIRGGRGDVRRQLYMPTLGAATQHNARMKEFYESLVARGKPKKVALTACMRKLVVWSNAMLADNQPWRADYVKNC